MITAICQQYRLIFKEKVNTQYGKRMINFSNRSISKIQKKHSVNYCYMKHPGDTPSTEEHHESHGRLKLIDRQRHRHRSKFVRPVDF